MISTLKTFAAHSATQDFVFRTGLVKGETFHGKQRIRHEPKMLLAIERIICGNMRFGTTQAVVRKVPPCGLIGVFRPTVHARIGRWIKAAIEGWPACKAGTPAIHALKACRVDRRERCLLAPKMLR